VSGWSCKVHLKGIQVSYGNMLTEMLYILTLRVLVAVERLISEVLFSKFYSTVRSNGLVSCSTREFLAAIF
jgi:hypothetical protein